VFGDGVTSTAANPSHTYQSAGSYSAKLSVSDGTNVVAATPITITVTVAPGGLVAAFGFEEGSGTTTSDASGSANNGTLNGATWTAAGKYGNALSFNGSGAVVTVPNSASLGLSGAMTVEAWVYPTSVGGWQPVVYKYNDLYYLLGSNPGANEPATGVGDTATAGDMISSGTSLAVNTWTHLAGTYDGTTIRLYVNGAQVASTPHTGSISSSGNPLTIGGNTADGNYFTGVIDEVRVYNQALTVSQIASDMNTPVSATVNTLAPPANLHVVGVSP
jgi:PKD repeat protein